MSMRLSGSLAMSGSIVATGQIIAQTLNVQQVTSSIVYSSGSNIFGNSLANTQIMTGSVSITGSLSVNGVSSTVGSGTSNFISKFTSVNSLGNSLIFDNGTNIGIGTQTPNYLVSIRGNSNSGIFLKQGGQIADSPTTASFYNGLTFENSSTTNAWSIGYSQGAAFSINYFDTNLTYRYLTISTSGNVGIGTITNHYATTNRTVLNVNGTSSAIIGLQAGNTTSGYLYVDANDFTVSTEGTRNLNLTTAGNAPIVFITNTTEKMRITSGGNVGIGTTSIQSILHVLAGSQSPTTSGNMATGVIIQSINGGNALNYGVFNGATISASHSWIQSAYHNTANAHTSLALQPNGGNVGIRTTSPISMLTVDDGLNGNITAGFMMNIGSTSQGASAYGIIGINVYGGSGNSIYALRTGYQPQFIEFAWNDGMKFHTTTTTATAGSAITGTERMRITNAGNVGIGTTDTQTFRLAVDGPNVGQGDTTTTIRIFDTTSATTGTGGGISFAGYFSGTSSIINTFSYIKGGKENSTAGDYASYLSFGTRINGGNATERMRITSTGDVGIGITDPASYSARLTVNGNIRAASGNSVGVWDPSNTTYVQMSSPSNRVVRWTNDAGTEYMRITSGGNVGIGTTTPSGRLHLTGTYDGAQNTLNLENNWPNTFETSLINFWAYYNSTNPQAVIEAGQDSSATNAGVIMFKTMLAGAAPATRMIIRPSGNVGIGTTNPFSSLDVSTSSTGAICVGNSSNTISDGDLIGAISFVSRDTSTFSSGGVANIRSYATATYNSSLVTADLRFYTTNGVQNTGASILFGTERIRITSDGVLGFNGSSVPSNASFDKMSMGYLNSNYGWIQTWNGTPLVLNREGNNVGINTTNTIQPLTIQATPSAQGIALLGRSGGNTSRIDFFNQAGNSRLLTLEADNSISNLYAEANIPMVFSTNATERMRITNIGRVGIGTTSPYGPLHVVGGTTIHNGPQTFSRVQLVFGQVGAYTQVKVIFNKTNWGSVAYDIKLASAGGTYHIAGAYYSNPGFSSLVTSISTGNALSVSMVADSPLGGNQGATWTFSGATMVHPIVTVDIACGNGFQVTPDSVVVEFS